MIKEEQIVKQSQKKKIYWVTEFDESVNRWSRPLEYNNSIIEIEALTQEEAVKLWRMHPFFDKKKQYNIEFWKKVN